jgi:hypothetical protein
MKRERRTRAIAYLEKISSCSSGCRRCPWTAAMEAATGPTSARCSPATWRRLWTVLARRRERLAQAVRPGPHRGGQTPVRQGHGYPGSIASLESVPRRVLQTLAPGSSRPRSVPTISPQS